jgi:hypothetical protein
VLERVIVPQATKLTTVQVQLLGQPFCSTCAQTNLPNRYPIESHTAPSPLQVGSHLQTLEILEFPRLSNTHLENCAKSNVTLHQRISHAENLFHLNAASFRNLRSFCLRAVLLFSSEFFWLLKSQ